MKKSSTVYRSLVSADDSALVIIDYQASTEEDASYSSVAPPSKYLDALIAAARELKVPTVTTVHNDLLNGQRFAKRGSMDSGQAVAREEINPWESVRFSQAVSGTGKSRLVVAGRFTETAVTFAVLSALEEGYDVFFVQDASSGLEEFATRIATTRMLQAGAVPVGVEQIIAEWQRGNA